MFSSPQAAQCPECCLGGLIDFGLVLGSLVRVRQHRPSFTYEVEGFVGESELVDVWVEEPREFHELGSNDPAVLDSERRIWRME